MTVIKVTICGDAKVGKSSIFNRYVHKKFFEQYISTIGVDHAIVDLGNDTKLQIWDTAGEERFFRISTAYLRSPDAVVIVYDNSTRAGLQKWFDAYNEECPKGVPLFLVRNKCETEKSDDNDTTFLPQKYQFVETDAKMWPDSPNNLFTRVVESVREMMKPVDEKTTLEESCKRFQESATQIQKHMQERLQEREQLEETCSKALADYTQKGSQIKDLQADPAMQALTRAQTVKIGDISKLTELAQGLPILVYRGIKSHIIPQSRFDLACRNLTERDETTVSQQLESGTNVFAKMPHESPELFSNGLLKNMADLVGSTMTNALKQVQEQKKWTEQEKCSQVDEKVLSGFQEWLNKSEMTPALWSAVEEGFLPGSALWKSMQDV